MSKLDFQKHVLPNGFTIFSKFDPGVEFVHMSMITPVGTFHNHGNILPGTFHFLEHLLAARSQKYPELHSNTLHVNILGGEKNARTFPGKTSYDVSIPSSHFREGLEVVKNSFFEPFITDDFIQMEKGIIANERKRRLLFYPTNNEKGEYRATRWMSDVPYSVEQIFGSDEDFEKMNTEYFLRVHNDFYKTRRSYLVIAGNFNLQTVVDELKSVDLGPEFAPLERSHNKVAWNKREFHEFETKDVSRYEYSFGWLHHQGEGVQDVYHGFMNSSIRQLVCSFAYGNLYNWLRNEKQWIYEIIRSGQSMFGTSRNIITFPLNSINQVNEVRNEVIDRFLDGISNSSTLEKFKKQKIAESVFDYERVEDKMNRTLNQLHYYGETYPEKMYFDMVENLSVVELQNFFYNHIGSNLGEMVCIPKK